MKLNILFILTLLIGACQTYDSLQEDVAELATGNINTANILDNKTAALLENECPTVEIVDDLSSISDFQDPNQQSENNLVSRVGINSAESTCKLSAKSAIVDLKIIFDGNLGPKGRKKQSDKPFFSYPFFVAVTTPSGKILAKEIFAASITYNENEEKHSYFENLRQIIPIKSKKQARLYNVLIGFQVTPDQLQYNRDNLVAKEGGKVAQQAKPNP